MNQSKLMLKSSSNLYLLSEDAEKKTNIFSNPPCSSTPICLAQCVFAVLKFCLIRYPASCPHEVHWASVFDVVKRKLFGKSSPIHYSGKREEKASRGDFFSISHGSYIGIVRFIADNVSFSSSSSVLPFIGSTRMVW